jgi:hypothetical protein
MEDAMIRFAKAARTADVAMFYYKRARAPMAANVTKRLWEMSDIVDVLEAWEAAI